MLHKATKKPTEFLQSVSIFLLIYKLQITQNFGFQFVIFTLKNQPVIE